VDVEDLRKAKVGEMNSKDNKNLVALLFDLCLLQIFDFNMKLDSLKLEGDAASMK
jgi:hypothetical protein